MRGEGEEEGRRRGNGREEKEVGEGEEREEKGGRCGWYTSKKEVTL